MKMGLSSKRRKRCTEDRISELPDATLCHILSFLSTVEAVKTSVLSHRWENVWASVPTIDVCDYDPIKFDCDSFSMFLDGVLFAHDSSKVHRFRILCTKMVDPLLLDYWVSTAIGCNVVELDLGITPMGSVYSSLPPQCFELPGSLFTLKSLEKLKLSLQSFTTITPEPSWFPNLKFLHVSVSFAGSHLMENLFSCCPVLEELNFDAEPEDDDDSVFKINISAPKLKRLHINLFLDRYDLQILEYEHKVYINANAPNLETFTFDGNLLAIYTSGNAKSLNEAKIDCADLHAVQDLDYHSDAADNLHRLFTGILNVTDLSVSAPIFGDPHIVHQYHLPTFVNLKHLKLLLQACCSWQPLISFLNASPNLESLVLKKNRDCLCRHHSDELHHEWNPPEFVPACLVSHLKKICIRGYKGTPDQMEVAEYLLKHGAVLNKELFTGILNVTDLSVSAPIFGDPHIVHQYHLPTFVNLKHLKLLLQACCSWQPLISFLNASPNLESLVLKKNRDCLCRHHSDELHHEWNPPEFVPACLVSHLKKICIRGYKGTPDQMEVAEYLLKHGAVLNKVTVHRITKCMSSKKEKKLWQGLKKLPRGSKSCQIAFPCLSVTA